MLATEFLIGLALFAQASQAQSLYNRGTKEFAEQKFSDSQISFSRAIEIDPTFAPAYRGLGLSDFAIKDYQAAYKAWYKAVQLNPQDEKTKYCLGRLFFDANMPNESAAWLRKAIELDPSDYEALTYLGLAAEVLSFNDTAEDLYRKAILVSEAKGKPYSWAFLSLGNYFKKQGSVSDALTILAEGSRKCPEAHELAAFGELLATQGQQERAEQVVRQAIAMAPGLSQAHYSLGLLLKAAGHEQEAQQQMVLFQKAKAEEDRQPKVTAIRTSEATAPSP